MRVTDLSGLKSTEFYISDIDIFCYTPKIFDNTIQNRPVGCFLYIEDGQYEYQSTQSKFTAPNGSLVYIPKGSCHQYQIPTKSSTNVIQINFDIVSIADGQHIIFSEFPMLIDTDVSTELQSILSRIKGNGFFSANDFTLYSLFYGLLGKLAKNAHLHSSGDELTILPAVQFMNTHFDQKVTLEALAGICNISVSKFQKTFKRVYGVPPIEYKLKLTVEKSKELLENPFYNVSEISEMLNFSSVFYFSKLFKKMTGVSPLQYRKNIKQ